MVLAHVVPADQCGGEFFERWSEIQRNNPQLDSPFFQPEYTRVIARYRPRCEVAILFDGETPRAFFPYYRRGRKKAAPIGEGLTDFQGVIGNVDESYDMQAILRACRLSTWRYDHWISVQADAAESAAPWDRHASPAIDVSQGFERYQRQRRENGCKTIAQTLRKSRKVERDLGPVRFVARTTDQSVFLQLIDWKIAQYRRLRSVNHLDESWKLEALRAFSQMQISHFAGMLSALYIGDQLAAAHLGLFSHGVLHYWFAAYSPKFAKYSPGLILLVRLLQESERLRIRRVDLGKGQERYKLSLQNDERRVAVGSVDLRPSTAVVHRGWYQLRERIRRSALRAPAEQLVRSVRAWRVYR